jgi:hypothetical protein
MEKEITSERPCLFKKLDEGQKPQKRKMVSVNFHQVLFSLLDFLTLETGNNRTFRNVNAELPL